MKLFAAAVLGLSMFGAIGCKAVQAVETKLDSLSDAQLAAYLQEGALFASKYGLQAAQKKYPNDAARILTDAKNVDAFIRNVVLPALQGAPTGQVVTNLIGQITTLVNNTTLSQYEIIVAGVIPSLPLPKLPTDKLSPRAQGAAIGLFTGVAQGIEAQGNITPPPAPPPAPAPAPAPPK